MFNGGRFRRPANRHNVYLDISLSAEDKHIQSIKSHSLFFRVAVDRQPYI